MKKSLSSMVFGAILLMAIPCHAQSVAKGDGLVTMQKEFVMRPFGTQVSTAKKFLTKKNMTMQKEDAPVFTPNWETQFDTENEFNWFTVIDANNDGAENGYGSIQNKWTYREDSKCAWYYCWSTVTNDWLVTPELKLRGGKEYTLRFKTTTMDNNFPVEMDVMWGTAPTVEGLNKTLREKVIITGMGYAETQITFTPDSDGSYYIGFHLTKVNYMLSFYLDDVSVEGTPLPDSPAAVSKLKITPDATGAIKANISFTLPTKNYNGTELTKLNGVRIKDGQFQIADIKDVDPGQEVTYPVEDLTEAGYRTYTVIPYNDVDDGAGTTRIAYIGLDIPHTPQNFVLVDDVDHITANWDPIIAEHDGVFFPEKVTTTIYDIARDEYNNEIVGNPVASVVGKNTIPINISTVEGEQYLKDYVMNAENEAGPSLNYYRCYPILLGKPYSTPFEENFDGGKSSFFWMKATYKTWGQTDVYSIASKGFDSKLGCVGFSAFNANDSVYFYSGKISMNRTKNPKLAFKYLNNASYGSFYTYLKTTSGKEIKLDEIVLENDKDKGKWMTKIIDLSQYAGERYIQVGFAMATNKKADPNQVLVDHIFIGDMPATDLGTELFTPKSVEKGKAAPLTIRVNNFSSANAESFKLKVTADDKVICDSTVQQTLGAWDYALVDVAYKSNLLDMTDKTPLKVVVTIDGDTNPANDTAEATILLTKPAKAPTTGLFLQPNETPAGTDIKLTWDAAPKIVPKTDNIESYPVWSTYDPQSPDALGGWSMIDGDAGYCWGFNDAIWYYSERTPFAYTVFNPYNYDGYETTSLFSLITPDAAAPFIPYSGDQYWAAIYSGDVEYDEAIGDYVATIEDADNWLISPEQDGREQEISFFVNNYAGQTDDGRIIDHAETYEVLYSTTDKEQKSFKVIGEDRKASGGQWQEVKVQLPAGTKYFAIHHKSPYNTETGTPFIFMLDDISVQVDNEPVAGYRVYRNGELIGEPTGTAYVDPNVSTKEDYLYQVTVVYADGTESGAISQTINVSTGIDNIDFPVQPGDIYSIDGMLVRKQATTTEGLQQGIYIINGKKIICR